MGSFPPKTGYLTRRSLTTEKIPFAQQEQDTLLTCLCHNASLKIFLMGFLTFSIVTPYPREDGMVSFANVTLLNTSQIFGMKLPFLMAYCYHPVDGKGRCIEKKK